jgi:tetratricopeptide (TPR) repeat protein
MAPDFALAHGGIADAYLILGAYNYEEPLEVTPLALQALTRAMALDATAGEPHATRGDFAFHVERDYALALQQTDRAVALSPGYAAAHIWRGEVLAVLGRMDESIEEMQRAIALDPLTPFPRFFVAWVREALGDHAQAERDYLAALKLVPGYHMSGGYARLLARQGRFQEALSVARDAVGQDASAPNLVTLGVVQALAGDRQAAQGTFSRVRALATERWISPFEFASMEAALGNGESALRYLSQGIEGRDFRAPMLAFRTELEFDSLAQEPAFRQLIASVRPRR